MAKTLLRLQARELRKKGVSVKEIASHLGIARSSASIWVRDIVLSVEQMEKLRRSEILGAERGRLKGALIQKQKRVQLMLEYKKLGVEQIGSLTKRELLIAGLALYWGEGYKKGRRVQFCNSDPKMIQFLLYWLQNCFEINLQEIRCRVGINEIHRERDEIIKMYWSEMTGIPLSQFTSTSFKKVNNKKIYENFHEHYGTLAIEISQPARFYGKIIGLIEGLSQARIV